MMCGRRDRVCLNDRSPDKDIENEIRLHAQMVRVRPDFLCGCL